MEIADVPSKTEYFFFPPSGFFSDVTPTHLSLNDSPTQTSNDIVPKTKKVSLTDEQKDDLYDAADENLDISLPGRRFISFTKTFKYLGSWIH